MASTEELRRQLELARERGWDRLAADAEAARGLPRGVLLAIASRESDMNDVVGDGGHGRGLFQIDDRAWPEWLAAHGAAGAGATPPVPAAAVLAAAIVSDGLAFGRRNGVPKRDLLRFALASYNAGCGGAIAGHKEGDCDRRTTGGDYGRDVLDRRARMRGRGRDRAPAGPVVSADGILRVGSRGPQVARLKARLRHWFEATLPGQWEQLRVGGGSGFGKPLEAAVRVFQEARGLEVDGEVGPQTLGALGLVEPAGQVVPASQVDPGPLPPDLVLDRTYREGAGGLEVRLIQSWLRLSGYVVAVDREFGSATATAVRAFQADRGLPANGVVDQATYDALTEPMRRAIRLSGPGTSSLGTLVVATAQRHLAADPREVGGANRGPWVRLYMDGNEGPDYPWCAGFATYVLGQACRSAGRDPVVRTYLCDDIARWGKAVGAFLPSPGRPARRRITPGSVFLKRAQTGDLEYAHCGIVVEADRDAFTTIEGNSNDDGSFDGYEVCAGTRGYDRMDFVLIA
ncbi:MAG: peptidoglycan-binding protein [Thermoleophilia bacterium]